jgi:phospholipid/cholesterol/gamma-HCH transport system substrate-binding protein
MLKRQLERYGKWLLAIGLLIAIAALSAAFILKEQRFRTPFADRYVIKAEFSSTSGLTPGLGQPVNVAGVRVGDITGAKLEGGVSVVSMSIDPDELPAVHSDATATLRPNTPLKDMEIELDPGHRSAPTLPEGAALPQAATSVPIDYDELTSALDADTRAYFGALVQALDRGLSGRGDDLRAALRALGPTVGQARRVGGLLADRRRKLARLVHNLSVLTRAARRSDGDLGRVVSAGNATLGAVASQDSALRESIARLPGTLTEARRVTGHAGELARALVPTLDALEPSERLLPSGLRATRRLLDQTEPLVRESRPVLRESMPLARDLSVTASGLRAIGPNLTSIFKVFDYAANELAYNPPGPDEGYLFWLAWAAHNLNSALSTEDAHGSVIRGMFLTSCSSLEAQPGLAPYVQLLIGQLPVC